MEKKTSYGFWAWFFALALVPLSIWFHLWTATTIWHLYLVPLGLPALSKLAALGLGLVTLSGEISEVDGLHPVVIVLKGFVRTATTLAIGFGVHWVAS